VQEALLLTVSEYSSVSIMGGGDSTAASMEMWMYIIYVLLCKNYEGYRKIGNLELLIARLVKL